METDFKEAKTLFLEGLAHYEAGRLPQAEQKFAAALSLAPGRPSVLTNLGAVQLKLGRAEEALALLQEALAQEPDHVETLGHCATALAQLGRTAQALPLLDRALALQPGSAILGTLRGTVLKDLGQPGEAAAAYRQALAHGGDAELLGYYLAGVDAASAPTRPPRAYVEALFDGYADSFDQHLVDALHYEAPRLLAERLAARGRRFRNALDLGCGTGACGSLLRKMTNRITGVDLSANMLEKAGALGVYDVLQQADVADFLQAGTQTFDLVIAADVFIYVGALDEVFACLARRMEPGGAFCFTLEDSEVQDLVLRPSLRYAHSQASIRVLAQQHGFRIVALEKRPVRQEQREPIAGLFVWLEKG